jgi:hypothetical protein
LFSLLFTQEVPIPDIFPIWDALISHFHDLIKFAYYVAAAFVVDNENAIISANHNSVLSILTKFSHDNSKDLASKACKLFNKDAEAAIRTSWLKKSLLSSFAFFPSANLFKPK